jgi:hypothetical protein
MRTSRRFRHARRNRHPNRHRTEDDTEIQRERGEDHGRKPGASSPGGAYVNFMMDEGNERVQATYRGNYSRLRETKRTYDPKNVFRINQNIPPAG